MICFEVYLNGEKLCLAGDSDVSVLTCDLAFVKLTEGAGEGDLNVGGLISEGTHGSRHPIWISKHEIASGDEITVKIVDSKVADAPKGITIYGQEEMAKSERDYYEHLKRKYEPSED